MPRKNNKKTYQTGWDLSVFYTSAKDPQIEKDIEKVERACAQFAKRYRTSHFETHPTRLLAALKEYERLAGMPEFERALRYFGFRKELDASDSEAEKMLNKLSERLTKAGNLLLFFDLALGAMPSAAQKRLLKDARLSKYRYHLSRIFLEARYQLTEPEEKILNLKSLPASQLWVAGTEKILNQKSVRHNGKELPLMEAFNQVNKLPKTARRTLWKKAISVCEEMSDVAENELNAIVLNKKINDELRGYQTPYSATIIGNENTEQSIEALVTAVTDRFDISARFYRLKAKMLKEKELLYPDKAAAYGTPVHIPFDEAVEILREVFYGIHPEYGSILDRMLANGQVDVFPKKGKSGGAFCASGVHQPTLVLLNQVDDMHSLTTFAHEMGHAIHSERSKQQPVLYQDYSTATAETASTLFENLVFESLLERLSKKQRIVALHDKIGDDIAAIMRQIAFFNFERELHETIRREGSMTRQEMATSMQKHLAAYLGSKVRVSEQDGYSFVYVPHFRMFFYVYTYAYGNLISNVLAERWKQDTAYIQSIDQFLTAGGSATPEDIFKEIGIDTSDPAFFTNGLVALEDRIKLLESLFAEKA